MSLISWGQRGRQANAAGSPCVPKKKPRQGGQVNVQGRGWAAPPLQKLTGQRGLIGAEKAPQRSCGAQDEEWA